MSFAWIPGQGPDTAALERMKKHFPVPDVDAPEAWFASGEIKVLFPAGMETLPKDLPFDTLYDYLEDTSSGIWIFGRFDEWVQWFRYLLPYLVERSDEVQPVGGSILGVTIIYFINLYPNGWVEEYPGFREDVLTTLGQCVMKPELWEGHDLSKELIRLENKFWWMFDGEPYYCFTYLAPLMIFCLKYLKPEEITTWIESISVISGPHWHYQLLRWLYRANMFLTEFENLTLGEEIENDVDDYLERLQIGWDGSHRLMRFKTPYEFIPKENLEAFKAALKAQGLFFV
jgi:hypothetical protein